MFAQISTVTAALITVVFLLVLSSTEATVSNACFNETAALSANATLVNLSDELLAEYNSFLAESCPTKSSLHVVRYTSMYIDIYDDEFRAACKQAGGQIFVDDFKSKCYTSKMTIHSTGYYQGLCVGQSCIQSEVAALNVNYLDHFECPLDVDDILYSSGLYPSHANTTTCYNETIALSANASIAKLAGIIQANFTREIFALCLNDIPTEDCGVFWDVDDSDLQSVCRQAGGQIFHVNSSLCTIVNGTTIYVRSDDLGLCVGQSCNNNEAKYYSDWLNLNYLEANFTIMGPCDSSCPFEEVKEVEEVEDSRNASDVAEADVQGSTGSGASTFFSSVTVVAMSMILLLQLAL